MGLLISRYIIEMENQRANQCQNCNPPRSQDENTNDPDIFHPSERRRILLGIGVALQATIVSFGCYLYVWTAILTSWPSRIFALEVTRILGVVYAFLFLYNATVWFVCIHYNCGIPRHRVFIALEFIRVIPWFIIAILFLIYSVPIIGDFIGVVLWIGLWSYQFAPFWLMLAAVFLLAFWSLCWTFVYFLHERKDEIKRLLRIGYGYDGHTTTQEDIQQEPQVSRPRSYNSISEDTPLLINRDEIV